MQQGVIMIKNEDDTSYQIEIIHQLYLF